MKKVLIVTGNVETARELNSALAQKGFACFNADSIGIAVDMVKQETLDILLVDADGLSASSWYSLKSEDVPKIKVAAGLPVIALMPKGTLNGIDSAFQIDDFVVRPFDLSELVARIKRIVNRTHGTGNQDSIKRGDLLMDIARCEVSINGRLVALTFKEYELLKFLMGHKGKVFTREALLDRVWGYDYYGGDRTVDVHVRRLRSKIEDVDHTFIETVRNIGYKFIG